MRAAPTVQGSPAAPSPSPSYSEPAALLAVLVGWCAESWFSLSLAESPTPGLKGSCRTPQEWVVDCLLAVAEEPGPGALVWTVLLRASGTRCPQPRPVLVMGDRNWPHIVTSLCPPSFFTIPPSSSFPPFILLFCVLICCFSGNFIISPGG